jgi:hypothetical protein
MDRSITTLAQRIHHCYVCMCFRACTVKFSSHFRICFILYLSRGIDSLIRERETWINHSSITVLCTLDLTHLLHTCIEQNSHGNVWFIDIGIGLMIIKFELLSIHFLLLQPLEKTQATAVTNFATTRSRDSAPVSFLVFLRRLTSLAQIFSTFLRAIFLSLPVLTLSR